MSKKNKDKGKKGKQKPPELVRKDYGVPQLAKELGLKEFTVRVKLRKAEIAKDGRTYGWDTKKEMLAVADELRSQKDDKPKKKKKKKKSKSDDD